MYKYNTIKTALITGVCAAALSSPANAEHFKVNGYADYNYNFPLNAGEKLKLEYYDKKYKGCTTVDWYLESPKRGKEWLDRNKLSSTVDPQFRAGDYKITMRTKGYDGRWFFNLFGCNNPNTSWRERTLELTMKNDGATQTKYPVMLVPGVMGYDAIIGDQFEYFYGLADMIEKDSDLPAIDVSLHPWQATEDRGVDLAYKILTFLAKDGTVSDEQTGVNSDDSLTAKDPSIALEDWKVNLIAHSHGATTSRVALRFLANYYPGDDYHPVASLTTVAGPHYGTPSADGADWVQDNWGIGGGVMWAFLMQGAFGNVVGGAVSLLSGNYELSLIPNYKGEPMDIEGVVKDFTQEGMARFNTCYPSAGLSGYYEDDPATVGTYFFETNLDGNADKKVGFSMSGDNITVTDCENTLGKPMTNKIRLVSDPDKAWGADLKNAPRAIAGNGLGDKRDGSEPDAIRYYSMTGEILESYYTKDNNEYVENDRNVPITTTCQNIFTGFNECADLSDEALVVIQSMYQLVNTRERAGYFFDWFDNTINLKPSIPRRGYTKSNDGFIPVNSTYFGEFIAAYPHWNHVDEQNGLFAATSNEGPKPLVKYGEHIERLRQAGL